MEGKFAVYYLYSERINKFYLGKTNNLLRRLLEHNNGTEIYTHSGVPWKLVSYISCASNQEATNLEYRLKLSKNKKYINWYFEKYGIK